MKAEWKEMAQGTAGYIQGQAKQGPVSLAPQLQDTGLSDAEKKAKNRQLAEEERRRQRQSAPGRSQLSRGNRGIINKVKTSMATAATSLY